MDIYVEENIDRMDQDQWNALVQKNAVNTIFQTYAFNRAAQEVYGRKDGSFIVCVKDGGELIAIFPLMLSELRGKRVLQFIAGERSDYGDILCSQRREEVLELIWQYLFSRRKEWDEIHLSNLPLEASFATYISKNEILKRLSLRSSQDEAAYVRLKEDEAYTKSILNKKRVNTYRHSLQKNGSYKVLHLTDPQDIQPYLEDFFSQHIKRWQGTAYPSLFHDEKNKQFYRRLVQTLPKGWITFTILQWDNQALAYHFGFTYGKTFIWYKPSYNVAFLKSSPGQVLLQELLEYACAKDFDEFDFGVGKEAFKYRFSNKIRRNNSFKVFSSRSGYLLHYVPLALQWRWGKCLSPLEKFFAKPI